MIEDKYPTFEDWFNEIEGYGFRSERVDSQSIEYVEDSLLKAHHTFMVKWLHAAFDAARDKKENQE